MPVSASSLRLTPLLMATVFAFGGLDGFVCSTLFSPFLVRCRWWHHPVVYATLFALQAFWLSPVK